MYDKIAAQGRTFKKEIDLTSAKTVADDYFLLDMTSPHAQAVVYAIDKAKREMDARIQAELGNPIQDPDAYAARRAPLDAIKGKLDEEFFAIAKRGNLAGEVLDLLRNAETAFRRDFQVELPIDVETRRQLEKISLLFENRPVTVTPELVEWATRRR